MLITAKKQLRVSKYIMAHAPMRLYIHLRQSFRPALYSTCMSTNLQFPLKHSITLARGYHSIRLNVLESNHPWPMQYVAVAGFGDILLHKIVGV
jgi:hypothetical protein